jgi:hypothetical protein
VERRDRGCEEGRVIDPSAGLPERSTRHHLLDGLVVNDDDVWVVVGDPEEVLSLLLDDDGEAPLTLCRGLVGEDSILIGAADPHRDRWISNILGEEFRDLL